MILTYIHTHTHTAPPPRPPHQDFKRNHPDFDAPVEKQMNAV